MLEKTRSHQVCTDVQLTCATVTPKERLTEALNAAWRASGLTIAELARRTHFAPAYLSRALRGRQTLSLPALHAVAAALGADGKLWLREAGLDAKQYRSRHYAGPPPTARIGAPAVIAALQTELDTALALKRAGAFAEARGALDCVERLSGLLAASAASDERLLPLRATLLAARIGIVQDTASPGSVCRRAAEDLQALQAIAESALPELRAAVLFHEGDLLIKDGRFEQAEDRYARCVDVTTASSLRARALAGRAIALAECRAGNAASSIRAIEAQIACLCASASDPRREQSEADTGSGWAAPAFGTAPALGIDLWSTEILARAYTLAGDGNSARALLERAEKAEAVARHAGLADTLFSAWLAVSRFVAARTGVLELANGDLRRLAANARRLSRASQQPRLDERIAAYAI